MMLTCLGEHSGKEQHHGANDTGETACRERGRPAVYPCPAEGERSHAVGVLCHHGVQPSLCSVPAPHLCEAGGPGGRDAGPYETLSVAQTAEACGWSCRSRGARLGVPPCRGALQ
jgi:hypothetical protein